MWPFKKKKEENKVNSEYVSLIEPITLKSYEFSLHLKNGKVFFKGFSDRIVEDTIMCNGDVCHYRYMVSGFEESQNSIYAMRYDSNFFRISEVFDEDGEEYELYVAPVDQIESIVVNHIPDCDEEDYTVRPIKKEHINEI